MKSPLSVGILLKRRQPLSPELIKQVAFAAEILVVRDGPRLASDQNRGKVKFFGRLLQADFSRQRNFLIRQAQQPWLLFVDGDERVSSELSQEVQQVLKQPQDDGYCLPRQDYFLGRWLKHGEPGRVKLIRLGRKGTGWWRRPVHEVWQIKRVGELRSPLKHYAHQDLTDFKAKVRHYAKMEADYRLKLGEGWSLVETLVYPIGKWGVNYLVKGGWRDGRAGWWYALMMAYHSALVRKNWYLLQYQPAKPDTRVRRVWRWGFYGLLGLAALGQLCRWQVTPTMAVLGFEMGLVTLVALGLVIDYKFGHVGWPRSVRWMGLFMALLGLALVVNWPGLGWYQGFLASLYWWRLGLYVLGAIVSWQMYRLGVIRLEATRLLVYLGMLIAVMGWLQYLIWPDLRFLVASGWDDHFWRLSSTLLDPGFTGLILSFLLLTIEWRQGKWWRLSWLIALSALLLTYARSAYGAYGVGELVLAGYKRQYKLALGRIILLGMCLFWLPRPAGEGVRLERTQSIENRAVSIITAWDLFKAQPLFGIGFNAYRQYTQLPAAQWDKPVHPSGPDNSYLLILATAGLAGGLGMMILGYGWWRSYKGGGLVMATTAAVGVHALFNNSLFYPLVLLWVGLLLAGRGQVDSRGNRKR
ncbi:hypothetical protein A2W24_04825 [Microgenomates group bacterium RBG_16_45_19]|nr:MAG: hypothetical protein A2W24_04825 [Microgenomates group bacterium RBG_16_45_19]